MSITSKAIGLLERRIIKTAHILDIRAWSAGTFYEIDLHIPGARLGADGVQHINCRVAPLVFRDYTIAQSDRETSTCTLFIDAAHKGQGSNWVRTLRRNDVLSYLNIEMHRYNNSGTASNLFLGDQSAVGHFLALQQLMGKGAAIEGAVVIENVDHRNEFNTYYSDLNMDALPLEQNSTQAILHWLGTHNVSADDVFIAGNSHMVASVRRHLKELGYTARQLHAQGFWD